MGGVSIQGIVQTPLPSSRQDEDCKPRQFDMRLASTFVETIPLPILVTLPLAICWTEFRTIVLTDYDHYFIQIAGINQAYNNLWLFFPLFLPSAQDRSSNTRLGVRLSLAPFRGSETP